MQFTSHWVNGMELPGQLQKDQDQSRDTSRIRAAAERGWPGQEHPRQRGLGKVCPDREGSRCELGQILWECHSHNTHRLQRTIS